MKKQFIVILGFLLTMSSCKKGGDDPFLSFHSRKARVVGVWKMTSFKTTITGSNGVHSTIGNGTQYTTNIPGAITTAGILTREVAFKKDGTFVFTTMSDSTSSTSMGVWNFTGGVGDLKNKSQITMFTQSTSTSSITGNNFNVIYDLTELRNKKMVWNLKRTHNSGGGITSALEEEIIWEQK